MSQPSYWRCIKTLNMGGDIERESYRAFTKDKVYQGEPGATPGGEWAMCFVNDMGDKHLMKPYMLHRHFAEVANDQST